MLAASAVVGVGDWTISAAPPGSGPHGSGLAAPATSPPESGAEGTPHAIEPRLGNPEQHIERPSDAAAPQQSPLMAVPNIAALFGASQPFVQVNVNPDGMNILGDAANEPSIAVDPTAPNRIAIGWRQFDSVASNFRQAGFAWSNDGGRSWTFPGSLMPGQFRSDPVLDVMPNGRFLYYSLRRIPDSPLYECDLFDSTNGGQWWNGPVGASGGDKPWIAVDRTSSPGHGHLYAMWNPFVGCCNGTGFARSVDGGVTFDPPVSLPGNPIMGTMAVDPTGNVFIVGRSHEMNGMVVLRSYTAKYAWLQPFFVVQSVIPFPASPIALTTPNPNPGGLLGQLWIAIDHSTTAMRGNIYVMRSLPSASAADPLDVLFWRSTDGGLTWSEPIVINDDGPAHNRWQWFSTISVAPTGRIDVVWNDTRNSGLVNISELYYAKSTDGGATWSPNARLSEPWDSWVGWPNQQKIGDYYHMISDAAGAHLAWAATFNNEQDIYYLRIGDYDCNNNATGDSIDLAQSPASDCNGNVIPDECEIAAGAAADANNNGVPDSCEAIGDINGDGHVNGHDIGLLLDSWSIPPAAPGCHGESPCLADLNHDGLVNGYDLSLLLENWG